MGERTGNEVVVQVHGWIPNTVVFASNGNLLCDGTAVYVAKDCPQLAATVRCAWVTMALPTWGLLLRTKENILQVLKNGVYQNPANVDSELVEEIYGPSCDRGAREVFVSVITGTLPAVRSDAWAEAFCELQGGYGGCSMWVN